MLSARPPVPTRPIPPAGLPGDEAPPPRKQRTLTRDAIEVLLIAVILYIAISFNFQTVRVEGESMVPTLQNQDFLIASRVAFRLQDPQRGDIIVLQPPSVPDKDFIKRVMAVPGDNIEIKPVFDNATPRNDIGTVVLLQVGGKGPWTKVEEHYLNDTWNRNNNCCIGDATASQLSMGIDAPVNPLHIPDKQYFVMGDNRNNSEDSRAIGLIPRDHILAKAFLRIFPVSTLGGLGNAATLVPQLLPVMLLRRPRGRRQSVRDPARGGPFPGHQFGV